MKISVIGLGKLGLPLTAVMASKGHDVIGVDLNTEVVKQLNAGIAWIQEVGLQALITQYKNKITATTDYQHAISNSDVSFVIVPTPSNADGVFDNKYILAAIQQIGHALRNKKSYHLIVITSTVMPGSTGGEIQRTLETAAGRPMGETLGLCYSPEFIALGSVIKNMLYPDAILIGESDKKAGDLLAQIYLSSCNNKPPVQRLNFVNAELTKLAVNTFVTTKISYANMLSDICDRLPGADVDVVTNAIGCDSRIGHKYLRGGVAYGGPCFPRDNIAMTTLAKTLGAKADLAIATDTLNRYQTNRVVARIQRYPHKKSIAILGLAYKPDVNVVENSQGIRLANQLVEHNYQVSVYDPVALHAAKQDLVETVIIAESMSQCIKNADIVVIMTAWPLFADKLMTELLQLHDKRRVIIDCWRLLQKEKLVNVADVVYLGQGNDEIEERVAKVVTA
jgi:UDPglucose 6-dehydrogenase